jgi:hypothetical protein
MLAPVRRRIASLRAADVLALAVLAGEAARLSVRLARGRRRRELTLSPVADYARPGWRMPARR